MIVHTMGEGKPMMIAPLTTGYCGACQKHVGAESHLCEGTLRYPDGSISSGPGFSLAASWPADVAVPFRQIPSRS